MLYKTVWYYKNNYFTSIMPENLAFKFNDYLNNHSNINFGCFAIFKIN